MGRPPPHPRGRVPIQVATDRHRAAIAMPTLIAEIGVGLQPPQVGEHVLEAPARVPVGWTEARGQSGRHSKRPWPREEKDVMAQLLVVEDNPDILHLIWTQLRARGHQVLGASSGPEALAAVEVWGPPQVAVLDVAMPSMDGLNP